MNRQQRRHRERLAARSARKRGAGGPDSAPGISAGQYGAERQAKSEEHYKKILRSRPDDFDALFELGVFASRRGDSERAIEMTRRAIAVDPNNAPAHFNLGVALQGKGEYADAAANYRRALEIDPGFAQAHGNLGNALLDLNAPDEAIASFRRAIEIRPAYAEANYNLGNALHAQGRMDEAVSCYRRAVEINPRYARAYNNLGNALKGQGKTQEAIACYRKACEIAPDYARAHFNVAILQGDLGRSVEAKASLQRAVRADAEFGPAVAGLLQQSLRECEWRDLDSLNAALSRISSRAFDQGARTDETPLLSLTRGMDAAHDFRVAKSWSDSVARRVSTAGPVFDHAERSPSKARIKVGYLSNNFGDHPVSHLMLGLFRAHDRADFEIVGYSYGPDDGSAYRRSIERECDGFVDLLRVSYAEAARRVHADGVDILVDLNGHTQGVSLEACALRPAPVQVSYLGFPGTSGADFFDYIVTDEIVTPQDQATFYSENFAYLPHCYQVNDSAQSISDQAVTRQEFGLPADGFVFCSFNQPAKIEPIMFDVWMRILDNVPGSVLWLQQGNERASANLRKEAETRGVASDRLVFAGRVATKGQHLARLRLAGLALDTRIYNGHTTTSDMLWAGVPVVTLQGTHFASRVSSSILTAVGFPELVTTDAADYEALAVRLATDAGANATVRRKLDGNRTTEPLFDTKRFARNVEQAYRQMWEIYLAGDDPRQITIHED